ncbi:sushi domain-containing protein 1 isoform X7 [Hippoglossus stenolepis]|uniref:sushi domain-containing protein 1 isoform X7 n=1 Tax=Hippoglossus stenolepis TaxID=195615 RepID=UPI001FB0098E|nr:sushi domain-containing protein 1 isoform X7 [Hippoglossus stenolepis]
MIVFFLLCVVAGMPASGQILDVCASCHSEARCEDKLDGSGKVCNCKYGFVGNGRSFCQDKDECQIGAMRICGMHTKCHNTYGSYDCTCLSGYNPSNNMAIFIPNDGTQCQDIDECKITGLCGDGGRCRNLEGSFECSCQVGYQVDNGTEPFHPHRDKASCKVVDCGQPASVEDTVLLSATGTTYGSVATRVCDEGFIWGSGHNTSVCGADGLWSGPTMVCEDIDECKITGLCGDGGRCRNLEGSFECSCQVGYQVDNGTEPFHPHRDKASCKVVDCGQPASVEDTVLLPATGTTYGSVATRVCDEGFIWGSGHNTSVCGADGLWSGPTMVCEDIDECRITGLCGDGGRCRNLEGSFECSCQVGYQVDNGTEPFHPHRDKASCKVVDCGQPASVEDTVLLPATGTTYGSVATRVCDEGFIWGSGHNTSVCGADGLWSGPTMVCEVVDCGQPASVEDTVLLPATGTTYGSVATRVCDEGFIWGSGHNTSVCGADGLWSGPTMVCEEISCGLPLIHPRTNLLWDRTSRPGSVVLYECMDGFYPESGTNISVCSLSGDWGEISIKCQAKCGPVPFLANSEVVWHNRSVVIHRCVDGYHSWRGSNVSVCGSSGTWQTATLRCIEIKPALSHVHILNEKCVHWKAEKYEEDSEAYKVTYTGTRDYQRSFRDERKQIVSSKAEQLKVCLHLLPATNYSISITALSARFTASITTNTSLSEPPVPFVYYGEFETPVPTLRLNRSANTLDPISLYQVFVLPVEDIMVFDCSSPGSPDPLSENKFSSKYITAQILIRQVGTQMNFTVGDGLHYGGFYNAPLEKGRTYYIILRAVSQWKTALKSSCVLWAKVRGTSYVLMVSSLAAAAAVGLVAFAILGGYSCMWLFKKK